MAWLRGAGAPPAGGDAQLRRQRLLLSVLGGLSDEEQVALGDIDLESSPFTDATDFHGFLLNNGAAPALLFACMPYMHETCAGMPAA